MVEGSEVGAEVVVFEVKSSFDSFFTRWSRCRGGRDGG